ncbi:MAG: YihY/virulence factor BrkB family protein [Halobaculum sp.]
MDGSRSDRPWARALDRLDSRPVAVARAVVARGREADVPTLAAAVAYYAFVSVLPLVVVSITLASLIAGEAVAARVLAATGDLLTESGQSVIERALTQGDGRGGTTLIGLVVLLWSGLRLFRGLDTAFSRVYGVDERKSLLRSVRDALVAFGASALGVVASVAVGSLVAVTTGPVAAVAGPLGLVVGLTLVFLPLFYLFPDVDVTLRAVVPGAVAVAVGWVVLNVGFVAYAAVASVSAYGVVGAILLLVTWFYLAALVVLFAATLNVVLAGTPAE